MLKLHEKIKEFRMEMGLSRAELGDMIGFDYTTISKYESGGREPDIETLCKMADLFSVSLDELVRGEKRLYRDELLVNDGDFRYGSAWDDESPITAGLIAALLPRLSSDGLRAVYYLVMKLLRNNR